MAALRHLWAAGLYWPVLLLTALSLFLLREIWALSTHNPQDTLSDWVWRKLHVVAHQPIGQWDALHFLVFGVWLVMFTWLTWHFFFKVLR